MDQFKRLNIKCFCVSLLFYTAIQAGYAQAERFSPEIYISDQGDTLRYRQFNPDYNPSRTYPLVVFLHGSGERGSDNEAQLKWGVQNYVTDNQVKMFPAFVIAPQCPEEMTWSNLSDWDQDPIQLKAGPSRPMELTVELIRKLTADFPIDTNRIYITGLSMGGYGTFDAMMRYPRLFAAAIPVCGGGDTSKASAIAHIPIWIVTGAEDHAVDPRLSVNMLQALTAAGAKPGFTQYPEVGHFSWIAAYSDPVIMSWLFRQHK